MVLLYVIRGCCPVVCFFVHISSARTSLSVSLFFSFFFSRSPFLCLPSRFTFIHLGLVSTPLGVHFYFLCTRCLSHSSSLSPSLTLPQPSLSPFPHSLTFPFSLTRRHLRRLSLPFVPLPVVSTVILSSLS